LNKRTIELEYSKSEVDRLLKEMQIVYCELLEQKTNRKKIELELKTLKEKIAKETKEMEKTK